MTFLPSICHSEPCAEFISVSFRNLLWDLVPNANLCNLILEGKIGSLKENLDGLKESGF